MLASLIFSFVREWWFTFIFHFLQMRVGDAARVVVNVNATTSAVVYGEIKAIETVPLDGPSETVYIRRQDQVTGKVTYEDCLMTETPVSYTVEIAWWCVNHSFEDKILRGITPDNISFPPMEIFTSEEQVKAQFYGHRPHRSQITLHETFYDYDIDNVTYKSKYGFRAEILSSRVTWDNQVVYKVKLLYYWNIYGQQVCDFMNWKRDCSVSGPKTDLPYSWCKQSPCEMIRDDVLESKISEPFPSLKEALLYRFQGWCKRVRVKRIIQKDPSFWYGFTEEDDYFCQGKKQIILPDLTFSQYRTEKDLPPARGSFIYFLGDKKYFIPDPYGDEGPSQLLEYLFAGKKPEYVYNEFLTVLLDTDQLEKYRSVFRFFKSKCI